MATRPDPYLKKDPGEIIRAGDWNEIQVQSREELGSKLAAHGHSGGDDASPVARAGIAPNAVDGTRIDPQSDVALKALKVNGRVLLDEIDALVARFNGLNATPVLLKGDLQVNGSTRLNVQVEIAGPLNVTGAATIKGAFSMKTFSSDDKDEPSLFIWSQDYGKNWDEQVLKHSAAKGMFGRAGFGIHMDGTREWGIWSSGWTPLLAVEGGTGRVKTRGDLNVGGALAWGNSQLSQDQGGSIELGGSNAVAGTGTPFIDFHFRSKQEDYNVRLINDADRQLSVVGNLNVTGPIYAGNSDLYFTRTDHRFTAFGETAGYAAIHNATDYDALMLLGRANGQHPTKPGVKQRIVKLWDFLDVNGEMRVTGSFLEVNGGGSERCYIGGDGAGNDVQLGSLNASVANVAMWNTATGYMALFAKSFNQGSDLALKDNVETLTSCLSKVLALRGVRYSLKAEDEAAVDKPNTERHLGFIAQEVQAVVPEVVSDSRGLLSLSYTSIIPLLVEAIKEQQTQIDALRAPTRKTRKPQ
jgi:hypothetical protein